MKRKLFLAVGGGILGVALVIFIIGRTVMTNHLAADIQDVWDRGNVPLVLVLPMSGNYKYVGDLAHWAAGYAADEINAGGGISGRPVELIVQNTMSDTDNARSIVKKAGGNALLIIGPVTAPEALATAVQVHENGIIDIGTYSFDEGLTGAAPYGISYMSNSERGELACVQRWAGDHPDIRRVVIFTDSGDASKAETAQTMVESLPKLGLEVAGVVDIASDVSGQRYVKCAIQALNQGVDGYISLLSGTDYANILVQLRRRGVDEGWRITASFSAYSAELIDVAGNALDGTYIWNKYDPSYDSSQWRALVEAYEKDHHGELPRNNVIVDIYDSVMVSAQCFWSLDITGTPENYDAEKDEICQWFYGLESVDGIQGSYSWENGEKIKDYVYFVFDGTEPVNIDGNLSQEDD